MCGTEAMKASAEFGDGEHLIELAKAVLQTEAEAVLRLAGRIDQHFVAACRLLLSCKGRIVVSGMGKSGHIAGKIAATLASTGSPAFFVHPGEASHGDLGMVRDEDVFIGISNSGNSPELLALLPTIKRMSVPLIAFCGQRASPLAEAASVYLDISVEREACPMGLAPTASTTAALAMGDALAIALLNARGFTEEDFARSHPGGSLGRKLLLRVTDVMAKGEQIPLVDPQVTVADALLESSRSGLGFVLVVDKNRKLLGIFTDGDLRRSIDQQHDLRITPITTVMTPTGQTIRADELAVSAVACMEQHRISALPVVDDEMIVQGAVNMHLLLAANVV